MEIQSRYQSKNNKYLMKEEDDKSQQLLPQEYHTCQPFESLHQKQYPSDHLQQYSQILDSQLLSQTDQCSLVDQLFKKERIRLTPNQFTSQIEAEIFSSDHNFRVLTMKVHAGNFHFFVHILNQTMPSPFHTFSCKSNHEESTVFLSPSYNFSIKCFQHYKHQNPAYVFAQAFKEYCLLKIASGLGVGPSLPKEIGFDIIIYQDCIEFSMQKCLELNQVNKKLSESDINLIKYKITLLHRWRIMHVDIKPGNIMYSSLEKQFVCIDFGFSRIISEKIGLKTVSAFAGTINYCSHQMKMLYLSQSSKYEPIDLYFNDAHCLRLSLEEIQRNYEQKENQDQQLQDYSSFLDEYYKYLPNSTNMNYASRDVFQYCSVLRLKFLIYHKNRQAFNTSSYGQVLHHYSKQFLSFIQGLPYCSFLAEINQLIINIFEKDRKNQKQSFLINMQCKKQKIFTANTNFIRKQENQNSFFLKKMDFCKDTVDMAQIVDGQKIIITFKSKEKEKEKLLSLEEVKKIDKILYFKKIVEIVDITAANSTFEEKCKISKVMLEVEKVTEKNINTQSQYVELEMSLRYILSHFIVQEEEYFQFVIPTTIINLVILDALSVDQLIDIFNRLMQVKGNVINLSLMLFRCNLVIDWIKIKVISSYNEVKFEQILKKIIFSHLKQLEKEHSHYLTYLLEQILNCQINLVNINDQFCHDLINSLRNIAQIQEETIEELAIFAFYLKQNNSKNIDILNQLNALIKIYDYNPAFFQIERITYFHLSFLKFFQAKYKFKPPILSNIYKIFTNCLQQLQIISKFQFYYSFHHGTGGHNEISQNLDFLLRCCQDDEKARQCYFIITQILDLLGSSKAKPEIKKRVRSIFNVQLLQKMKFPENTYFSSMSQFYQKIVSAIFLILDYGQKECLQLGKIQKFYEQLKNYWYDAVCPECKQFCFQHLLVIQIKIHIFKEQFEETAYFCIEMLKKAVLGSDQKQCKIDCLIFLIKTVILMLSTKDCLNQNQFYEKFILEKVKELNLFQICFIQKNGERIYFYLSFYTLQKIGKIQEYLFFQKKMLQFVFNYPNKQFVILYNSFFINFAISKLSLMKLKAEQILSNSFTADGKTFLNPYACIFFGVLLKLLPDNSKFIKKIKIFICSKVDSISIQAKVISFQHLFTYLLCKKDQFSHIRQRRRIIMKYSSYLNFKFTFPYFISKLGLKKQIKMLLNQNIGRIIMRQMVKFHQNLSLSLE